MVEMKIHQMLNKITLRGSSKSIQPEMSLVVEMTIHQMLNEITLRGSRKSIKLKDQGGHKTLRCTHGDRELRMIKCKGTKKSL
jgi:hypothetical protein